MHSNYKRFDGTRFHPAADKYDALRKKTFNYWYYTMAWKEEGIDSSSSFFRERALGVDLFFNVAAVS